MLPLGFKIAAALWLLGWLGFMAWARRLEAAAGKDHSLGIWLLTALWSLAAYPVLIVLAVIEIARNPPPPGPPADGFGT